MIIKQTEFVKSAVKPSQYPEENFPEIAFAGRSNVGKSSLINALINRKNLVKTSSKPGCTQLINFFKINNELSFVDLPGYGYAKISKKIRAKWSPMMKTYLSNRKSLAGVVLLIDIRRQPGKEELGLIQWLEKSHLPCLAVLTKADKFSKQKRHKRLSLIADDLGVQKEAIILFSAKSKLGRDVIWNEIDHLVWKENNDCK